MYARHCIDVRRPPPPRSSLQINRYTTASGALTCLTCPAGEGTKARGGTVQGGRGRTLPVPCQLTGMPCSGWCAGQAATPWVRSGADEGAGAGGSARADWTASRTFPRPPAQGTGSTACIDCPQGTYSSKAEMPCMPTPKGTFTDTTGSTMYQLWWVGACTEAGLKLR